MTISNTNKVISEILRGSEYALTIFTPDEINLLEFHTAKSKTTIICGVTGKSRPAKPEEIVRQLYVNKLMGHYQYPRDRIALEKSVYFGSTVHEKAADIVVWEQESELIPYIIGEIKRPKRRDGLEQLKSYCNAEGSPIGLWTNGGETIALHREEPNIFRNLPDLPTATQKLADLLSEQWTLEDLTKRNKLVTERTSLKSVILDMENLVLSNAGVDSFEEVFKLIFAKLYDEWQAGRGGSRSKRYLDFRVTGSAREFEAKVTSLFNRAKMQWRGVFDDGERLNLEPDHLKSCGSFLEDIRLFESNLQVIDEAFEYLSLKYAKGEKGQYFTPRHVIDMCVKMLNPTLDEFVIDTAAGSCGFTVHSFFHVWGHLFTAKTLESWQTDYAATHVYGIDFDPRSVKIARALNLIAGDGKSNVYRANTLDPRSWSNEARVGMLPRLRRFIGEPERDRWNIDNYRYFDFDVLMTNPPFAGDVKDTRITYQFDLAKNERGKWQREVSRDILFVERNMEFLKPGGRMAIILPQGRFNNVSDNQLRSFIGSHARVLACVSLHINTFKPHTNTKTSVLFLQKWNDDPFKGALCPRKADYPIFFGVSESPGKDNLGNYRYRIGSDNAPELDSNGQMMVEHDLDEIATDFIAWAKLQRLSFHR